jgi:hypothetical protein
MGYIILCVSLKHLNRARISYNMYPYMQDAQVHKNFIKIGSHAWAELRVYKMYTKTFPLIFPFPCQRRKKWQRRKSLEKKWFSIYFLRKVVKRKLSNVMSFICVLIIYEARRNEEENYIFNVVRVCSGST